MWRILGLVVMIYGVTGVTAQAAEEFAVPAPYTPYVVESVDLTGSVWLGDLDNYPHLYAFTLPSTTTVQLELRAVDHTDPQPLFAGILVRDRDGLGVQEIVRLGQTEQWSLEQSPRTKMQYQVRRPFEATLAPGQYRFEISTPDNVGRYELQFGNGNADYSYWATLGEIRQIQQFHGYGWWHIFRTAHVYVPLVLLVILLGMAVTWRYAKRRRLL